MNCIMLHGLGQSADGWNATIHYMGDRPDVFCPELLDWLKDSEACYGSLYRGLEKYCAQFEGRLDLCGLSLGGILALQYGIEHPERVRSMALIGTRYVMPKGLLRFQNALFRLMPKRAFQGTGFAKEDFISLSKSMRDLDFQAGLSQIRCPVLVACGERDKANRSASLRMKERIPGAELAVITGAGHEVNVDAPAELGAALDLFFNRDG